MEASLAALQVALASLDKLGSSEKPELEQRGRLTYDFRIIHGHMWRCLSLLSLEATSALETTNTFAILASWIFACHSRI